MASEYYYLENGAQQGPVGQDALAAILTTRLTRDTLVWGNGLAEWTPANQVPELAGILAPPPAPVIPPALPAAPAAAYAPSPAAPTPAASYAQPAAAYAAVAPAAAAPSLNPFTVFGRCFSWKGKFNRGEFIVSIATSLVISLLFGIVIGVGAALGTKSVALAAVAGLFGLVMILAVTVAGLGAVIRRVHDLGVSPWLMLLALVPIANFVWIIYLLVAPGKPDAPAEQPVPWGPIGVMIGIWVLIFVATLAAIAIPAFLAYRQKANSIDMQAITSSMTEGLKNQLSLDIATVTCPTEPQPKKAGSAFDCTAIPTIGGRLTVKVSQQDDAGNVKWEVAKTDGLIDLHVVEQSVVQGLKEQANAEATVTCGGKYRASNPGEVFDCQAKTTDGRQAVIAVTITDSEGHVSWEVKQ
jgi:uncharacterized membrane protein YhaH (DUF805 family)